MEVDVKPEPVAAGDFCDLRLLAVFCNPEEEDPGYDPPGPGSTPAFAAMRPGAKVRRWMALVRCSGRARLMHSHRVLAHWIRIVARAARACECAIPSQRQYSDHALRQQTVPPSSNQRKMHLVHTHRQI